MEVYRIMHFDKEVYKRLFLCGLNIFSYNGIDLPEEVDPPVVFVTELIRQYPCVALIGNMALKDQSTSVEEVFGDSSDGWFKTPLGLIGGVAYIVNEDEIWPAGGEIFYKPEILCNRIDPSDGTSTLEYMMRCDALALYVNCKDNQFSTAQKINDYHGSDTLSWIVQALELCDGLIVPHYDNWQLNIYYNNVQIESMIKPALNKAVDAIISNPWFIENRNNLIWKDDPDFCLGLKK